MLDNLSFVQSLAIGSAASAVTFAAITAVYCCYMKARGLIADAVAIKDAPVVNLDVDIEKGLFIEPVKVQPQVENNKVLTFAFDCGRTFDEKNNDDKELVSKKLIGCKI